MTRRYHPRYRGGSPVTAQTQNLTNSELGRLTGLQTNGAILIGQQSNDTTPGRLHLPPRPPQGIEFEVLNISGEAIPAYGCIELTRLYGDPAKVGQSPLHFAGTKPGSGDVPDPEYCFNGPLSCREDGIALVRMARAKPVMAIVDYNVDTAERLAWETILGPVSGQWDLGDGHRFKFCGHKTDFTEECLVLEEPRRSLIVGIEIVSIDDSDPDDIIATCAVTYRPCGMNIVPGEDEYAQIEVHDRVYHCLFTDAAVGDRGAASYMISDVDEDPYGVCDWECMGLCC